MQRTAINLKKAMAYAVGVPKAGDKAKPNGKPLPYVRIGYVYSLQKVAADSDIIWLKAK